MNQPPLIEAGVWAAPLTRIELAGSRVTGGPHHQVSSAADPETLRLRLAGDQYCRSGEGPYPLILWRLVAFRLAVAESRRIERPAFRQPTPSKRVRGHSLVLSKIAGPSCR